MIDIGKFTNCYCIDVVKIKDGAILQILPLKNGILMYKYRLYIKGGVEFVIVNGSYNVTKEKYQLFTYKDLGFGIRKFYKYLFGI